MEIANQKDEIKLKCKMCLKALNKHSKNEVLIQCGTCNGHGNYFLIRLVYICNCSKQSLSLLSLQFIHRVSI